jgi:hypothetical protein
MLISCGLFCAKDMNETKRSIDLKEGAMTVYGYARVSTDGQTLAAQDAALREAGAAKVYAEKISGASTDNRRELARALKALGQRELRHKVDSKARRPEPASS